MQVRCDLVDWGLEFHYCTLNLGEARDISSYRYAKVVKVSYKLVHWGAIIIL